MQRDVRSGRVRAALDGFVREPAPDLPFPGEGDTWQRLKVLADWSARDLSLGRLVEGHADALSILREANQTIPKPFSSYGVWAARSSRGEMGTVATPVRDGLSTFALSRSPTFKKSTTGPRPFFLLHRTSVRPLTPADELRDLSGQMVG